jgi:hypothetical protein
LALLLSTAALGCGVRAAPVSLPATDRDPLPYVPAPASSGTTDGTVALAATGGEDQARRMLRGLLRAIRDADERRLEQLLADQVLAIHPSERVQSRAECIRHLMEVGRRGLIQPDVEVEAMVDLANLRVSRASQLWQNRDLPAGIRGTDIVLEVPMRDEGRMALRMALFWQLRGYVVVRPGQDARIVGY